jgi:hypothetical protein
MHGRDPHCSSPLREATARWGYYYREARFLRTLRIEINGQPPPESIAAGWPDRVRGVFETLGD